MKLTKKGLLKIIGGLVVDSPEYPLSKTLDNWNREKDFDQDDFQNVVILTVEEADDMRYEFKILTEAMDDLNYEFGTRFYTDDAWEQLKLLKQRIKQAEKDNE